VRPGDCIRYNADGRPDAVVEWTKPGAASIQYLRAWTHLGLNRTVVAQVLFGAELEEWHVLERAS